MKWGLGTACIPVKRGRATTSTTRCAPAASARSTPSARFGTARSRLAGRSRRTSSGTSSRCAGGATGITRPASAGTTRRARCSTPPPTGPGKDVYGVQRAPAGLPIRRGDQFEEYRSQPVRLTWQASPKNKFNFLVDYPDSGCTCRNLPGTFLTRGGQPLGFRRISEVLDVGSSQPQLWLRPVPDHLELAAHQQAAARGGLVVDVGQLARTLPADGRAP